MPGYRKRSKSKEPAASGHGVDAYPPMKPLNDQARFLAAKLKKPIAPFAAPVNMPAGATARQILNSHITNSDPAASVEIDNHQRNRRRSIEPSSSGTLSSSRGSSVRGNGASGNLVPRPVLQPMERHTSPLPPRAAPSGSRANAPGGSSSASGSSRNRSTIKPEESEFSYLEDDNTHNQPSRSFAAFGHNNRRPSNDEPGPSQPRRQLSRSKSPVARQRNRSRSTVAPPTHDVNWSSTRGNVKAPERYGATTSTTTTTPTARRSKSKSPSASGPSRKRQPTPSMEPSSSRTRSSVASWVQPANKVPKILSSGSAALAGAARHKEKARKAAEEQRAYENEARKERAASRASRSPSVSSVTSTTIGTTRHRSRAKSVSRITNRSEPFHPNPATIIHNTFKNLRSGIAANTFLKDNRLEEDEVDSRKVTEMLYDYIDVRTVEHPDL